MKIGKKKSTIGLNNNNNNNSRPDSFGGRNEVSMNIQSEIKHALAPIYNQLSFLQDKVIRGNTISPKDM